MSVTISYFFTNLIFSEWNVYGVYTDTLNIILIFQEHIDQQSNTLN